MPGLLYFYAWTLSVQAGPLEITSGPRPPPVSPLLDRYGRKCGFLSICNHASWPIAGNKAVKLAVVSVTSYGDLSSYHAQGQTSAVDGVYGVNDKVLEQYFGSSLPHDVNNFDFLNVLLIQETDRKSRMLTSDGLEDLVVYERAGLGFIHRTALHRLDEVQWCNIALG